MNGTESQALQTPAEKSTDNLLTDSSTMEAIGAVAAIILAVLGVAGVFPNILAPIGTIVAGIAILTLGQTTGWNWERFVTSRGMPESSAVPGSRPSAEFMAGLAGIVLGILALLGFSSQILMAIAVIALGAALLLSGFLLQFHWFTGWQAAGSARPTDANKVLFFGLVGQVLTSVGALALGILAVVGLVPLTLILVGLICLGVAALIGGVIRAHWRAVTAAPP